MQRAGAVIDGERGRQHRELVSAGLGRLADQPLDEEDQQVAPGQHGRAWLQAQAADIDDVQDVVTVIQAPVFAADAQIPALARADVPVPDAKDPGREREMVAGPRLICGIDHAISEHGGLEPVVDALPDAPPQLDDRIEENLLSPAALPGGGRGQRAHSGERRHDRVADQLSAVAQAAGIVAEPARMPLERTLLRGRQTLLPDRMPGDPHFRHNGSSAQHGHRLAGVGQPERRHPGPKPHSAPRRQDISTRPNPRSPSSDWQRALRKPPATHRPAYRATTP